MAVFIKPESAAELELERGETAPATVGRPLAFGTEVGPFVWHEMAISAEDGTLRDITPSRMACHCHNSATTSSRYENVAISVPGTPSLPAAPNGNEIRHGEGQPMGRNISIRASLHSTTNSAYQPQMDSANSCFAKFKLFYEHSPLRHFAPFLLLIAYALFGALLFFLIESENERQLLADEQRQLELLRSRTIQRLEDTLRTTGGKERLAKSKKVLEDFERDFVKSKVPEGTLEWTYLGALFYGQALSILYAIVGIPLVLAILNQTSKKMTKWLSEKWICYRKRIKAKTHKVREGEQAMEEGRGGQQRGTNEEGEGTEEELLESRTIPVWMALSIVSGYMCAIAAIFLVWESRWSYFTSFYFICISCLTIGLGDVVPDHPHMLILMFVFVIFGLSFVSMLLSVIQIKMEEWLYKMMIKMQKEYQKALREVTDPTERDRIIAQLFAKEPWYMRQLAPLCVSETQKAKLENLTKSYENTTKVANTRGTQTEHSDESEAQRERKGTQAEGDGHKSLRAAKTEDEYISARAGLSSRSRSLSRSISDATSLPMDPASISPRHFCTREVQTELNGNSLDRMERDKEREEEERREERVREERERVWERERAREEEERKKREREKEAEEQRRQKEKEKSAKSKTQSKAVGTGTDFVVRKEDRGTQLRAAISNKRTDTKGLFRTEDRAVDTVELIKKCMAKAVQTDQPDKKEQRSMQTMFPSQEEEQPSKLKADQRRRLFSLTGREAEFEEETALEDAWAQCTPPPELCDSGVQTLPICGAFADDGTVERLLEDDDDDDDNEEDEEKEEGEEDASNSGSVRRKRSESVTATVGDGLEEELLNMAYPKRAEKKDLVIQTDDSYLRIARRLDKLRTNRTDINVYCTGTNPPPRKRADGRRKSLRFLEPIRDSFRPRRQSKTHEAEDQRQTGDGGRREANNSPQRTQPTKEGRVAKLVATHEQNSSGAIQRGTSPLASSAIATVSGKARKGVRHVRMRGDEGEETLTANSERR